MIKTVSRSKRIIAPLTAEELEAGWRRHPGLIGAVAPPMWLWIRDREKQRAWRKFHGLEPADDDAGQRKAHPRS
jgi:hypothetical protein